MTIQGETNPRRNPHVYINVHTCVTCMPILDIGDMGVYFVGAFFRNKGICLLAPTKHVIFNSF